MISSLKASHKLERPLFVLSSSVYVFYLAVQNSPSTCLKKYPSNEKFKEIDHSRYSMEYNANGSPKFLTSQKCAGLDTFLTTLEVCLKTFPTDVTLQSSNKLPLN